MRPGEATAESLEPARIGIAADGVLAILGPGLSAPVETLAAAHPGKIEVFEWREETLETLKHGVKQAKLSDRVNVARIDLEAHVFAAGSFDGIFSIDDFAYCGYPPHLSQQLMKSLKPGACAVVEAYVGLKGDEALKTAFASSFAEPQIRPHGDVLQVFKDTGFTIEADEDLTDEFLATARQAFKQLGERLQEAGAVEPAAARELAWEAEAWRMRLKLLAQRRLERRRFVLRRPADQAQAENTNAPAG
ncbi:MAG: methyltransferase domain-containing protein [Hyphomonadaceae bacterium]|nr:methyltransferase domain-containing protein [Hyphomonadaceae bacterium]